MKDKPTRSRNTASKSAGSPAKKPALQADASQPEARMSMPAQSAPDSSPVDSPAAGDTQAQLDESLAETFPASDPIAPAATSEDEVNERSNAAPQSDEPAVDTGPVDFPTSAHHPDREQRIREAAYRRWESRGGQGGHPDTDWVEAESEVDGNSQP
ncbi:MAG: hypothetical protein JWQ11_1095 [Rhizobacter sp.]|nr:hypothetical protein [Rhizobacter sp.]